MRTTACLVFSVGVSLAIGSLVSCDDKSPTRPAPVPTPLPTVTTVRVQLIAPPSVEPNESVQLTLTAEKSDGTTQDVTSTATWSPSNSPFLTVNGGLVTGRERGETTIVGRYEGRFASALMMVLPRDTFKLSGVVSDSGLPLEGATVQVTDGIGVGLTTVSGFGGSYQLYGVAGQVRLQSKKEGYQNQLVDVPVTGHSTSNISMAIAGPRPRLAGTYDLTVTVGVQSSCFGQPLPQAARSRTYVAAVQQDGPRLSVALSGADFVITKGLGDRFEGTALSGRVTFVLGDSYYYYLPGFKQVVETFPPTALIVSGIATVSETTTGLSGRLSGFVGITRTSVAPFVPYTGVCSGLHGFEMVRR